MSRIISIVKDPHLVSFNYDTEGKHRMCMVADYRVFLQQDNGEVIKRSLINGDMCDDKQSLLDNDDDTREVFTEGLFTDDVMGFLKTMMDGYDNPTKKDLKHEINDLVDTLDKGGIDTKAILARFIEAYHDLRNSQ